MVWIVRLEKKNGVENDKVRMKRKREPVTIERGKEGEEKEL